MKFCLLLTSGLVFDSTISFVGQYTNEIKSQFHYLLSIHCYTLETSLHTASISFRLSNNNDKMNTFIFFSLFILYSS